ncbi:Sodium- and chloride-dependent GABA transporter 2 [Folsomia candida]|uniref:Sodium-and chloride-dependent GABA transporter 2 n=2 Tax=Folsomia candida TaxID=158441 RepID=A0A226EXI8_FOLCA|nr:Sodium- and chloride-dependent GABA transporter 2 [Folsomia candida]
MTALGSYNKFNHNFIKDCTFVACVNSGTSFFSGFVVFSVLGFMANQQNTDISKVAESGPGLVFIAYPKALAQMPWAPLWSVLFFFMIILLGLNSQFVGVEGFVTAVVDVVPHILRVGKRREVFIAGVSSISFLIGLSMVTNGGMYVFQIFDYYSASGMTLLWVCFCECIAVAWFYDVGRFSTNIKSMVGFRPNIFLAISWSYLTPILTMAILLYSIIQYEPLAYNKKYEYPVYAQVFGWALALSSMLMIPIHFIYYHTKTKLETAKESDHPHDRKYSRAPPRDKDEIDMELENGLP